MSILTEPFSNLDEVPWAELQHAYGEASDVPELLHALVSLNREQREFAFEQFWISLLHQGSRYTATAAAASFLVQALEFTHVNHAEILELLANIAVPGAGECLGIIVNFDQLLRGRWVFPETLPSRIRNFDYDFGVLVRDCYLSVAEGCKTYQQLLNSNLDLAIHTRAAWILSWFPAHGFDAIVDLQAIVANNNAHLFMRASAALALGNLGYPAKAENVPALLEAALAIAGCVRAPEFIRRQQLRPFLDTDLPKPPDEIWPWGSLNDAIARLLSDNTCDYDRSIETDKYIQPSTSKAVRLSGYRLKRTLLDEEVQQILLELQADDTPSLALVLERLNQEVNQIPAQLIPRLVELAINSSDRIDTAYGVVARLAGKILQKANANDIKPFIDDLFSKFEIVRWKDIVAGIIAAFGNHYFDRIKAVVRRLSSTINNTTYPLGRLFPSVDVIGMEAMLDTLEDEYDSVRILACYELGYWLDRYPDDARPVKALVKCRNVERDLLLYL